MTCARCAVLEEENRQLRALLSPPDNRRLFGMTRVPEKVFRAILAASPNIATLRGIRSAVWGRRLMSEHIINVHVVKVRRALPFGVKIKSVKGEGYLMDAESAAIVRKAMGAAP